MALKPIDFNKLNTYSVHDRFSKVTVDNFAKPLAAGATVQDFLSSLPDQLLGVDFPELIERLATCHKQKKPIIIGMGSMIVEQRPRHHLSARYLHAVRAKKSPTGRCRSIRRSCAQKCDRC